MSDIDCDSDTCEDAGCAEDDCDVEAGVVKDVSITNVTLGRPVEICGEFGGGMGECEGDAGGAELGSEACNEAKDEDEGADSRQ